MFTRAERVDPSVNGMGPSKCFVMNILRCTAVKCGLVLSGAWIQRLGKVDPVLDKVPRFEDVWGSGGVVLSILNVGTEWR
jgi:hypothetical protein